MYNLVYSDDLEVLKTIIVSLPQVITLKENTVILQGGLGIFSIFT